MLVITRIPMHRNDGSKISRRERRAMSKRSIKSRAKELLTLARKLAETPGLTWVEANNAVYGPGGPFARLFPGEKDRVAFARTEESRQIDQIIDTLPEPPVRLQRGEFSGKLDVRVPKSLHAALASEAEVEGVSLNQLVTAKLALHLQTR
jgi:hypothetical protein